MSTVDTTSTTLAVTRYGAPSMRLRRLDRHTRVTLGVIKAAIRTWKTNRPDVSRIHPPMRSGVLPMRDLPFGSPGSQLSLPTFDEDWPAPDRKRTVVLKLLRSRLLFPLRDTDERWTCAEEARDTFQEVLPVGSYLARPYHHWPEMQSDAAMSRFAFAGLGALRLVRHKPSPDDPAFLTGVGWVSDLAYLRAYEVRPGFERYGARAFFGEDQRPVAIEWCHGHAWVRPGDANWEHAKWAWRCSVFVGATLTDHLVGVHWIIGNYVSTAARVCLGLTHPLRLLLKPFTWRTVTINAGAAETLCPEGGFVHRGAALTYPALTKAFADSVKLLRFSTAPEIMARKGALDMGDRFPWATDGLALYHVIHAFVDDYLSQYGDEAAFMADTEIAAFWHFLHTAPSTVMFPPRSRAAMVDVLSQFIWCVTGLHEAVGAVHEYVIDPTFVGSKIRPGTEMSDVQASMQGLLVMALTGLDMPRLVDIGDAGSLFGADHRGRGAFARFHVALCELSTRIDAANQRRMADADRPWPCQTFNPKHLEVGVSI